MLDVVPSGQTHFGTAQQSSIPHAAAIALQLPPPASLPPLSPPGGHAALKLALSFTPLSVVHGAALRQVSCDCVTVPEQMLAHCD